MNNIERIILAEPRGFCAGVERAIAIVEQAIAILGAPIYVRHEIVHNQFVCDQLRAQGAIFIEELDEAPRGANVIFSAHGVAPSVKQRAEALDMNILDATCPLVTKVHHEVERFADKHIPVIMIGHRGHPEVEGTMGYYPQGMYLVETVADVDRLPLPENTQPIAYVTQTTLAIQEVADIVDRIRQRFPEVTSPRKSDICYATQNRQNAVAELSQYCDAILVVGANNSSNANRLRDVADQNHCPAWLVADVDALQDTWFDGVKTLGITAGASAPEALITGIVDYLVGQRAVNVTTMDGIKETTVFPLPASLRRKSTTKTTTNDQRA